MSVCNGNYIGLKTPYDKVSATTENWSNNLTYSTNDKMSEHQNYTDLW
jgi:hypothetical protein